MTLLQSRLLSPGKGDIRRPMDCSEFWTGASEGKEYGSKRTNWNGGFIGQPQLADLIWPTLTALARGCRLNTLQTRVSALRTFWRFLERYQAVFPGRLDAELLGGALGQLWLYPPSAVMAKCPNSSTYFNVARIIQNALGLGHFFWPSHPSERDIDRDVPSEDEARSAFHLLSEIATRGIEPNAKDPMSLGIFRRWSRADELAAQGRVLMDEYRDRSGRFIFTVTEADLHATYRAIIARTGDPLPSKSVVAEAFGNTKEALPLWWTSISGFYTIVFGLYPSASDLQCLSQLFESRTGWNPSTTAALDITNSLWARPHGNPTNDLWLIESWKNRSIDWQYTICRGRVLTGPYRIITTLIERTRPLRELLSSDPSCLNIESDDDADKHALAQRAATSPWLAASSRSASGKVFYLGLRPSAASEWFRKQLIVHNARVASKNVAIDEYNAQLALQNERIAAEIARVPPESKKSSISPRVRAVAIPASFRPSDWRDIYATRVFQDSRYSMIVVQWALGHKHLKTTRTYLRNRLWRAYSERRMQEFQIVMFDELAAGRCDPTILHARLEFGFHLSDEGLARLSRYRLAVTEYGYACPSLCDPPPEVDPGNPRDGQTRCTGHCAGCPLGFAFDASRMVKELVTLENIRTHTSITVWEESQLAGDVDQLRIDLDQWPAEEIQALRDFWEGEFASGRLLLDPWSGLD